jgi:lysophospholipase L1-like esterase
MAIHRGRFRLRAGNLLLLGGAALVGLLVAELLTRLVAPQRPTPAFLRPDGEDASLYRLDSMYGLVLKPDISEPFIFGTRVETNALGLRDHQYATKRPREFRILSLGDSYAFGFGVEVEQSYTKVVERQLNRQFPEGMFSVINAGVTGYGTKQQKLAFQRLHPKLQPDFVLATFTAGNDVYENAVFEDQLRTGLQTPLGFIGRHSHAARLVLKATFPLWFFLENRNPRRIEHTIRLLKELEADLRLAGIPYLMLVIPARHQIRPEVQPAARLLMSLGFDGLVFRQNHCVIRHFQQERVPYVDLWPTLVAQDSVAAVSFAGDSHLNALGHETVGREIVAHLRGMLPVLLDYTSQRRSSTSGALAP